MKGRKERILFGEKNHINALSRSIIDIMNPKTHIHIFSIEFLKPEKIEIDLCPNRKEKIGERKRKRERDLSVTKKKEEESDHRVPRKKHGA